MKNKDKPTFQEFVEERTRKVHSALLEKGAAGMKNEIFITACTAIAMEKENAFKKS